MIRTNIAIPHQPPQNGNQFGYIYLIKNLINNKMYVGQRSKSFFDTTYWGSSNVLYKAFEKYGKENFICKPIDWAETIQELNQKEIYWIEFLGTFRHHDVGYNCSIGGAGLGSGKVHPCYGKHYNVGKDNPFYKIGVIHTEESRQKMSDSAKDKVGCKNNFYGKKHTEEWKREHRVGGNNPIAKKVYQYDLTLNLVKVFSCLKDVSKAGFKHKIVSKVCRNLPIKDVDREIFGRQVYNGFLWSYSRLKFNDQGELVPSM